MKELKRAAARVAVLLKLRRLEHRRSRLVSRCLSCHRIYLRYIAGMFRRVSRLTGQLENLYRRYLIMQREGE